MRFHQIPIAAILWLGIATTARTETLFSNLGQPLTSGLGFTLTTQRFATDFLTSSSATIVTGITLSLINDDDIAHTVTPSLFADNAGAPGTLIGTFDTISLSKNQIHYANFTTASADLNLAANTPYWVVLQMNQNSAAPDNSVSWSLIRNQATDPGSVFNSIPGTETMFSTGGAYQNDGIGNMRFSITGHAVPEPVSTGLLLGVFCIVTVAIRCRKCAI